MTPTRTRRLSSVIAGCVAMAASLTALGAIVVADIAEARETSDVAVLDDALPVAPPVKLSKVAVKAAEADPFEDLLQDQLEQSKPRPALGKKKPRKIDFGSFEGY